MKRCFSLLLALLLALSIVSVSAEDEKGLSSLPEVKEGCSRYFFLLPDDWFWDPSNTVGIYWSEGTDACTSWPGYKANKADCENVYYYDVPKDVESIIWNNFYENVNISASLSRYNKRTEYIPTEDSLNEISYDRMIAVVNSKWKETEDKPYPPCDWYCYLGGGEYADIVTSEKEETHYRYYFYLPEEWETENCTPSVYWWNGTESQSDYIGVKALKTSVKGLYYYRIPKDVDTIFFGNSTDFNPRSDMYFAVINCEFQKDKVYVIDFDKTYSSIGSATVEYSGDWYYFYGDGTFGTTESKSDKVYSRRSFGGDNPAPVIETNRYYFYMPEDWDNILSTGAGIYWWEGTNNCRDYWPGYRAHETAIDGLYYYDVPKDVTTIIWNNLVKSDITLPYYSLFSLAKQTFNIGTEYYEAGDSLLYPEGIESFDNMVFVMDYDNPYVELEGTGYDGEWYYYYGGGEYGTTPEKGEVFYNTRQIGTIPEIGKYPNNDQFEIYFLDTFNCAPVFITYTYGETGEEITESSEMLFEATSDKGSLYSFKIPDSTKSLYFSTDTQRSFDIEKNIAHNATFAFGVTANGKYDYKTYFLSDFLRISGDVNLDGKVNVKDATAIQKHLANIESLELLGKAAADFNVDEKITIQDATAIQKKIANIA